MEPAPEAQSDRYREATDLPLCWGLIRLKIAARTVTVSQLGWLFLALWVGERVGDQATG
jgi:hypothetical protein